MRYDNRDAKCSRTRLEFKVFVDEFILFYKIQCSRTRLEFKGVRIS